VRRRHPVGVGRAHPGPVPGVSSVRSFARVVSEKSARVSRRERLRLKINRVYLASSDRDEEKKGSPPPPTNNNTVDSERVSNAFLPTLRRTTTRTYKNTRVADLGAAGDARVHELDFVYRRREYARVLLFLLCRTRPTYFLFVYSFFCQNPRSGGPLSLPLHARRFSALSFDLHGVAVLPPDRYSLAASRVFVCYVRPVKPRPD